MSWSTGSSDTPGARWPPLSSLMSWSAGSSAPRPWRWWPAGSSAPLRAKAESADAKVTSVNATAASRLERTVIVPPSDQCSNNEQSPCLFLTCAQKRPEHILDAQTKFFSGYTMKRSLNEMQLMQGNGKCRRATTIGIKRQDRPGAGQHHVDETVHCIPGAIWFKLMTGS